MKKAYIIHGWGADSSSDWIPWLKKELESKNFEVFTPDMPNTDEPEIKEWIDKINDILPSPGEQCILIGHSIGCQAIMRYLEGLEEGFVDRIVLVAPWINLKGLEDDEWDIAKSWTSTPINFDKVKKSSKKIICLFSDNDKFVSIEEEKLFKEKLNAKTVIFNNKGHFIASEGTLELPEILEFII
jgi:predicted alpha/beta hydrolase family esterase